MLLWIFLIKHNPSLSRFPLVAPLHYIWTNFSNILSKSCRHCGNMTASTRCFKECKLCINAVPQKLSMQPRLLANFFGKNWLDLGKIKAKFWVKVSRFKQNQNLASPKTFDLLRLCIAIAMRYSYETWRFHLL